MTVGITNLSFTAQAQGIVLIYGDSSHTMLSDAIAFFNVNGMATAVYLSDVGRFSTLPVDLPILAQLNESQGPINLSLALTNGQFLHAAFCGDLSETGNCKGSDEALKLSLGTMPVPEPGTFLLMGSGLLPALKRLVTWKRQRRCA